MYQAGLIWCKGFSRHENQIHGTAAAASGGRCRRDCWGGGFGCPENINSLRFPSQNQTDSSANVQPTAGAGDSQQYQMLSIGLVGAGIAAFFGIRELRKRDRQD